jgi:hypothetical protein
MHNSRITRVSTNGINGHEWHPYLKNGNMFVLKHGRTATESKYSPNVLADSEERAIELLLTGEYFIRMQKRKAPPSGISPDSILIDGMTLPECRARKMRLAEQS